MRARFLADADLDQRIITGIKRVELEIDFKTANAAALESIPDPDVLQLADRADRVLCYHLLDAADFANQIQYLPL